MRSVGQRSGTLVWASGWILLVALQLTSARWGEEPVGSATLLFWIVVIAASACVVTSTWVLIRAHRDDSAELGFIGAYAFGVSALPLVHGLTVPGVLYGDNSAVMTSVMVAVPLAVAGAAPLVVTVPWIVRHWRQWCAVVVAVQATLGVALLIDTELITMSGFGEPLPVVLALAGLGGTLAISARHLRLYRVSRRRSVLVVSLGLASIAAGNLVWVNGTPMAPGFWLAHVLDIAGVFAATITAAVALRRDRIEVAVFRPLTLRDPLDALEYGLDPVVHQFIADLGSKDAVTREHVTRAAESALAVGEQLGLDGDQLRTVGLGALLHDIGKLEIPSTILNKPGRLDDDEFAVMQTHAAIGGDLAASSSVLIDVAPVIRHHHERVDGSGYPDGLAGDDIPYLARIVSVCDAWDAMVHDRHYRTGMDTGVAQGILREHAGSQWDAEVVEAFLATLEVGGIPPEPTVLGDVGVGCSCTAELPVPARM